MTWLKYFNHNGFKIALSQNHLIESIDVFSLWNLGPENCYLQLQNRDKTFKKKRETRNWRKLQITFEKFIICCLLLFLFSSAFGRNLHPSIHPSRDFLLLSENDDWKFFCVASLATKNFFSGSGSWMDSCHHHHLHILFWTFVNESLDLFFLDAQRDCCSDFVSLSCRLVMRSYYWVAMLVQWLVGGLL